MDQKSKGEVIFSLLFLVLSGLVFWLSKDYPPAQGGINVNTFPRILAGLIFIFSVLLIIQAITHQEKKAVVFTGFIKGSKLIITSVLMLIIYAQLLNYLGFIISSILLMFLLMFFFGEKRIKILLFVPIGFTVTLYLIFKVLAMVPLPEGLIFG